MDLHTMWELSAFTFKNNPTGSTKWDRIGGKEGREVLCQHASFFSTPSNLLHSSSCFSCHLQVCPTVLALLPFLSSLSTTGTLPDILKHCCVSIQIIRENHSPSTLNSTTFMLWWFGKSWAYVTVSFTIPIYVISLIWLPFPGLWGAV